MVMQGAYQFKNAGYAARAWAKIFSQRFSVWHERRGCAYGLRADVSFYLGTLRDSQAIRSLEIYPAARK